MIVAKEKYVFAFGSLWIPSCIAILGISSQCCERAKNLSAFIATGVPQSNYTCGQEFSPTQSPAPDLAVNLTWCYEYCGRYALYPVKETNAWALPLVTFILAAVTFSMAIPRRLSIHTSHSSLPWLPWKLIPRLLISLIRDAVILTLDTVFWVFAIMTAPASFILSGLFEVIIDYKVTRYIPKRHGPYQLADAQVVELLTLVLAGNLSIEGIPDSVKPQEELKQRLTMDSSKDQERENIGVRLSDILDGQVPFSTAVGAPVFLYIGSFIYSIITLSGSKGDKNTARALAFGIWWMIIVHVTIVSGCLLASNNPSSASIIYPKKRVPFGQIRERFTLVDTQLAIEDKCQAKIEACLRLFSLTYNNRYEPVWMWTRGKNKALWLRETDTWKEEPPIFREQMKLSAWGWLNLIVGSYFLVLLPCALAFWIEYTTPPVGVVCRALTILVYAVCQLIFVLLSAWSHFKTTQNEFWREHEELDKGISVFLAITFLLPSWIAAVFTTFAGTLMQITGIYQNCWCEATVPSPRIVSLASDTAEDRRSASHWNRAGYIAVGVLFLVTYCGWWGQRFLRHEFLARVKYFMEGQSNNSVLMRPAQSRT